MTKLIRRLLALALVVAIPALATAQTLTNLSGVTITTPSTGQAAQPFTYSCSVAGCASGTIAPLVQVLNTNPNGQALPSASAPVVLPQAQVTTDPCSLGGGVGGVVNKFNFNFTTSSAAVQIVGPASLEQVYICSIDINTVAANTINIIGGLSALCTTGTPVTMAGPFSWPALYTWPRGNGGATVYHTTTSGHGVCVTQSGTSAITISGTAVQQ
jgi:hypothetical protein